jgi:polyisoprenoid-binding protein YceI
MIGCASNVQRATIGVPVSRIDAPVPALSANAPPDLGAGPKWSISPSRAYIELSAQTAFVNQKFTFKRFHATAAGDVHPRFHAVVYTASLDGGAFDMVSFAKESLLETDTYPQAIFDGEITRTNASNCKVDGVLELHGVRRPIHFDAKLDETSHDMHLVATFRLARAAFNIKADSVLDAFVPDDVQITLDVRANREHVDAVDVDSPQP